MLEQSTPLSDLSQGNRISGENSWVPVEGAARGGVRLAVRSINAFHAVEDQLAAGEGHGDVAVVIKAEAVLSTGTSGDNAAGMANARCRLSATRGNQSI